MMEAAYDTIKKAIISGYFQQGAQLIEVELMRKLNISRTPIREALRKLENEGLVVCKPYKGAFVTIITEKSAKELYKVQAVLEGLAAKYVAENRDEAEIKVLKEIVDLAYQEFKKQNFTIVVQQSQLFHNTLWQYSRNTLLIDTLNGLNDRISLLRYRTLSHGDRMEKNLNEHWHILEAIVEKDSEKARNIMVNHINNAEQIMQIVMKV